VISAVAPFARRVLRDSQHRNLFRGKIIPYRGSWVEFDTTRNVLYVALTASVISGNDFPSCPGLRHRRGFLRSFYTVDRLASATRNSTGRLIFGEKPTNLLGMKLRTASVEVREEIAHSGPSSNAAMLKEIHKAKIQ